MVDAVKPDDATNAGAAAHNPTAQPSPATVTATEGGPAAAGALAQPELALVGADAKPAPEPVKAVEPAADAPKLDKTLLEKFDDDTAAKAAEDAKKAAEAAPKKDDKKAEAKTEAKPVDEKAQKPGEKAKEAAKPAETKVDVKPAEAAKPEPVAYEYKLPDTLKMDDALKAEVHTAFDNFRADPVKGAQALIDLHAKTMTEYATNLAAESLKNQFSVFNETCRNWEKQVLADPELGGAGHETAMGAVARARDLTISSAKPGTPRYTAERKEFDEFLRTTGAGSHPAFMRMLHNAARYIDEPQAGNQPLSDLKPPKGNGKAPGSRMYDHPSSQKVARA
jgi:hypothetical protein